MLRVTVEIVPFGDEAEAQVLSKVYIANVNTNLENEADYDIWKELDPREHRPRPKPHAKVKKHKRGKRNGLLSLVAKSFSSLSSNVGDKK